MTVHPFRFGIITETFQDHCQLRSLACRAEELGYNTVLVRDHLAPAYFGPQFAPLPTLAFLAGVTNTLRLGTMVLANDFRHPAILAKEAATLDVLSAGRFELGIGAGWLRDEYDRAGLAYDRNGLRIDRLEESLQILKACFASEEVTFAARHYDLHRHQHFPAPIQFGGPPILIGAGQPRMLRLAGKYADIVGLLTVSVGSGEMRDDIRARKTAAVRAQIDHVRAGSGERFEYIELSLVADIEIADSSQKAVDDVITRHGWAEVTPADVRDMPGIFAGSVDEICELMMTRRWEIGISYYVLPDRLMDQCAPIVERLSGR